MAVEEKELDQLRARAERLREQIAEAEAKAAETVRSQEGDIEKAQLETEVAMLERRLAEAKDAAKVSTVKEGAAGPLDQVTTQLEAAVARKDAPIGAVEPPAEAQADTDTEGK